MTDLREVVLHMATASRELDRKDDTLSRSLQRIEDQLEARGLRRVVSATIVPGVSLGWSARKNKWSLVIVDDHGSVPLMSSSREERLEVITSGALTRLVEKVLQSEPGQQTARR